LSDSLEEISELQQLARRSKQIITVGYIYRFVPIFEEGFSLFRKQQANGESLILGKTFSAFFRLGGRGEHQIWKHQKDKGGGAINEMLVHMIDLANWYFGPLGDIEVISCDLRHPIRTIQGQKITVDAEDFIVVKAKGIHNIEIFCQADLITPSFSQFVEVQAENGSFMGSIQNDFPSYLFLKENRGGYDAGKTAYKFGQRNILDIQMMAFVQAMRNKQHTGRNTIEDSLQLIEIMDTIRNQIGDR
jgi:predicted dehydrogenase